MSDEVSFCDLFRRFQAGDEEAVRDLERLYKPQILRVVRLRLTDHHLRRLVDSADVWQSIFCKFYVRAASGEYDLKTPRALIRLLATMAQNKIIDYARREKPHRNDQHVAQGLLDRIPKQPAESPSDFVARQELEAILRTRLTIDERYLCDQRFRGTSWQEIAAQVGGHPDALRKRLERALDKLLRQLGAKEDDHV
jgi:RNA polymerase sigma-70 factor (ECF subfamily)